MKEKKCEAYLQQSLSVLVLILGFQHDTQFLHKIVRLLFLVIHNTIEHLQINKSQFNPRPYLRVTIISREVEGPYFVNWI